MEAEEKTIDELVEEKVVEELEPIDQEEAYNNMLDECYPEVNIAGMTYSTSHALKELDPTAYRCGMSDYFGCDETCTYIDGEYYNTDDVDGIRDEIEEEQEEEE